MGDPASLVLSGIVRRLDGETRPDPGVPMETLENMSMDPKLLLLARNIPEKGIPKQSAGHCKLVDPLISRDAAAQVENPAGKVFVKVSNGLLGGIDWSLDQIINGVERVDGAIFREGLDNFTGVSDLPKEYQPLIRWPERVAATSLLVGGFALGKSGMAGKTSPLTFRAHAQKALRATGKFWNKAWPFGVVLFLADTQIASQAAEVLNLFDKDHEVLQGDARDAAKWAIYALGIGGSIMVINFPAKQGYRKVISPKSPPPQAKPMGAMAGLGLGLFFAGYGWYWDNASAQERILTGLYDKEPGTGLYQPWEWNTDYLQAHTASSEMLGWALTVPLWARLPGWQTNVTDRITKKLFGFGSEALAIPEGSRAAQEIAKGRFRITRGLRGIRYGFLTPKPLTFTAIATAVGLPLGIGINRMLAHSQAYTSDEAVSGTPYRTVITSPLSTMGITYVTAMKGFATSWEIYLFNMLPVNYTWSACSKGGENVFQVARGLADDYKGSRDPNERRKLRTMLVNLHRLAHDSGETKEAKNEKLKIENLMADAGLNAKALERGIFDYATPPLSK